MRSNFLPRMIVSAIHNRTIKLDILLAGVIKDGICNVADDSKNSLERDTYHSSPDVSVSVDGTINDSPKGGQCLPKKTVRFCLYTTVRRTLSRHSYTKEEVRDCWYQKEDYGRILLSCHRLVKKYEQFTREKNLFKYCMRGLEHHTAVRSYFRASNRLSASEAVFAAQDENPVDAAAIADCYSAISFSCHLWAHCVGLKDQKVAQRYHPT
ncbi:hypothetical protein IV203_020066 [Nitzschia inconspicua]|uniref:Uncharacterized protein n=1 Tax=Nitzschia inconspicua TaxID=303405 RepID=A0A9K3M217_9STRA|nr:hypothetical protein IV203_020066 [Nitzschia inconspicua]